MMFWIPAVTLEQIHAQYLAGPNDHVAMRTPAEEAHIDSAQEPWAIATTPNGAQAGSSTSR